MAAFLQLMGLGACAIAVGIIVMVAYCAIKEGIHESKRRYRYRHRFDKKPIAKCYCADCKYYDAGTGDCWDHPDRKMADNWFCWNATPKGE